MRAGLGTIAVAVLVMVSTAVSAEHLPRGTHHVALGTTVLTAGGYGPSLHVVHRRSYDWCQARSARLREFERRVHRDGRVSQDELRIAAALRADLAATCHPRWRRGGVRETR